MTNTDTHFVFINYLEAFATTSHAERERLLRSSLAENVVYTNPGVEGSGIDNLLRYIEGFQKKFPGGRFRMTWLRQQHGQALAEWTQLDQGGSENRVSSQAGSRWSRFPRCGFRRRNGLQVGDRAWPDRESGVTGRGLPTGRFGA